MVLINVPSFLKQLDIKIMVWVWIMFSSLDLVRRNINRAVSDNMVGLSPLESKLELTRFQVGRFEYQYQVTFPKQIQGGKFLIMSLTFSDYNTGQAIFLASFLVAELPGGLLSKKIGPDRMTPIAITLWGVACACQAAMKGRAEFFALRCITGVLQGGFIPEMVLYLSYYYKGTELPIRLSVFWTAIPLTQIYGSLLASGLLQLRGVRGWAGWQWLYATTWHL